MQRQFIKFSDASTTSTSSADNALTTTNVDTQHDLQKMNQKLRNYTDIIISETDRLTHLIGQLLGSNQLPNWQTLNIHEPLEHVLTLVTNQYPQVVLQRDYDLSTSVRLFFEESFMYKTVKHIRFPFKLASLKEP